MNYEKFGDSYDIVKQSILKWLSPCGEWYAHPMFTDCDPTHYAADYGSFLGVCNVVTQTFRQTGRDIWIASGNDWQGHLFLDPDVGLCFNKTKPGKPEQYLMPDELVNVAENRPNKLILVYDQSINRGKGSTPPITQIRRKLWWFKVRSIHGFAYQSHANFLVVSKDRKALAEAKFRLLASSKLPKKRLIVV